MNVKGFIWRDDIIDKLQWKHHVEVDEVQEVFANKPRVVRLERGKYQGEDVYAAFGQTDNGRYLTIIFIHKKSGKALINTARDMSNSERKQYGRK
ncbi:MAG: BrnT family toxin [Ardenticatenaceae bacterium]|nr:BrnT family toxin [Ardenticatenaceae bacterium]